MIMFIATICAFNLFIIVAAYGKIIKLQKTVRILAIHAALNEDYFKGKLKCRVSKADWDEIIGGGE